MEIPIQSEVEMKLVSAREVLLRKLETLFNGKAVEAHMLGSVARQQTDAYSDIDIWFTFRDENFDEIYKKRFEYYANLGDVIHSCEAPQNAPINGVHTALLIRSRDGVILVVDIYLCPLSTSFITDEGKKLFGMELPVGAIGFNQKKVVVDKNYRIDFFICFIFNTIKKLARHEQAPLDGLLREYEYLHKNYGVLIGDLDSKEQNLNTLEKVMENIQKVANKKQKEALVVIGDFARMVLC